MVKGQCKAGTLMQVPRSPKSPVSQYGTGPGKKISLCRFRRTIKHSSRTHLCSFPIAAKSDGYVQNTTGKAPVTHNVSSKSSSSSKRDVKGSNNLGQPCSSHKQPEKESIRSDAGGTIICEHFDACSGCSVATGVFRPAQYLQAAQFFGSIGLSHFPLVTGPTMGWRCRAKLAVRGEAGRPVIGLFREGSHEVTPIPNCSIHHPRINQAVALIKQLTQQQGTVPYEEATGRGQLRYIQLTAVSSDLKHHLTPAENDPSALVQVVLVWNAVDAASPEASQGRSLAKLLWQEAGFSLDLNEGKGKKGMHSPLLHSVFLNYQAACCNTVFGSSWEHVAGPETVWQPWQGTPVSIGPG
ncbi:hypothetical protein DUNSADRAFT_8526 [Dunaliella salina]|uniref:Uncharacterized protein n=1 Tax=Dunaliella salina TaxID=3046 RepID=A0ABQ7GJB5_DUNSA|nr:hypothetical protein DUNSADRAFT_8526 [Dunaliella salina]|eukprot:KAF5834701.1 hypothetical protein DUNSADRAFT_8526 [Dunaliella salina]